MIKIATSLIISVIIIFLTYSLGFYNGCKKALGPLAKLQAAVTHQCGTFVGKTGKLISTPVEKILGK